MPQQPYPSLQKQILQNIRHQSVRRSSVASQRCHLVGYRDYQISQSRVKTFRRAHLIFASQSLALVHFQYFLFHLPGTATASVLMEGYSNGRATMPHITILLCYTILLMLLAEFSRLSFGRCGKDNSDRLSVIVLKTKPSDDRLSPLATFLSPKHI